MLNDQIPSTSHSREHDDYDEADEEIREIHALTPPNPRTRQPHSHQSSLLSIPNTEVASTENFTSISREFSDLVQAGSSIDHSNLSPMMSNSNTNTTSSSNERESYYNNSNSRSFHNLLRIREDELMEETNPLAIVADSDNNPLEMLPSSSSSGTINSHQSEVSVQRVKKEEVESKIAAWQNAKVAKVNNRFKREDAVINGWENEQVQKANLWMKKVEVCFA